MHRMPNNYFQLKRKKVTGSRGGAKRFIATFEIQSISLQQTSLEKNVL